MPYVQDNPDWWMVELVDGFGSHRNCYKANKLRYDNKILCLKEEADTSHVNQAYDQLTAKTDKEIQRKALDFMLRDCHTNSLMIDQWKLLTCALAPIRHTKQHPDIWRKSFISTNTCPSQMIPLEDFCKKIESQLTASDTYDLKLLSADVEKYSLLPAYWQAMEPSQKRAPLDIVNKYGDDAWCPECCFELSRTLSVPIKDLPALQTCVFVAVENPSHLDRHFEEEPAVPEVIAEVQQLDDNRAKANDGLMMFQQCPKQLSGMDLFDHSVGWLHRQYAKMTEKFGISQYLGISPRTNHQKALLEVDYHQRAIGALQADINAGVPKRKVAQVRLDQLGNVRSQSEMINNPDRLERQKFRLERQRQQQCRRRRMCCQISNQCCLKPKALHIFNKGNIRAKALTVQFVKAILQWHEEE